MHEHAKKIYQEALNGKTVQRLFPPLESEWNDRNPFQVLPNYSPREIPNCWRVKPEKKTSLYRVYLSTLVKTGTTETANADDLKDAKSIEEVVEDSCYFRRWLTEWTPCTVEVEE